MKFKVAVLAVMALTLTLFNSSIASASMTPSPEETVVENNVVGFILKLKPGVNHLAPNGEPTGENYAGVELENSRLIGGGFSAVTFEEKLSSEEIAESMARLRKDPRVESVEPDQFIESANYVAKPIAPQILGRNDPIELPLIIKTAVRLPTMPTVTATDAWSSGTTERVRIRWTKPTGKYSGTIVGYRVQLYASGAWRTLRSQTYSTTRSHTTTSSYLKAGTRTAFRVAAIIRSGGRSYLGTYKKVYATPTSVPQSYPKFWIRNNLSNVVANWNLLTTSISRGGLGVQYNVEVKKPDGTLLACEALNATTCIAREAVTGTLYKAKIKVSNVRGTKSSPEISIKFTTAPAVGYSDDPEFTKQWYLSSSNNYSINAQEAWLTETGMENVIVAVLDTGITTHPDLPSVNLVPGYDMVSDSIDSYDGNGRDADPSDPGDWYGSDDSSWHGTHVAGIIAAADNSQGIVGIAPNVKIQPIRVLSSQGGTTSDIVAGINWAIGVTVPGVPSNQNIADVINLSIGGPGSCRPDPATLYRDPDAKTATEKALLEAKKRGITAVTAAGNDNNLATNSYPGNCFPTINVGATENQGKPTGYSNFSQMTSLNGSQVPVGVDISAPGGVGCFISDDPRDIYSSLNQGDREPEGSSYAYLAGTSMAAPMVAGTVALMYSAKFRQDPLFVPNSAFVDSVWFAIRDTAREFSSGSPTTCGAPSGRDGSDYGGYGVGIIDASASVAAIIQ